MWETGLIVDVVSGLSSLFIEWRRERLALGESDDEASFRLWLEHDALAQLLKSSEQVASSLISLRANEHERFVHLQALIKEIHAAVVGPTVASRWAEVGDFGQQLLRLLFEGAREDADSALDSTEITDAINADPKDLFKAARWLHEHGLVRLASASGGHWHVRSTTEGLLLSWSVLEQELWERVLDEFVGCLPADSECSRVVTLAEALHAPWGLVFHMAAALHARRLLRVDGRDQSEFSLVSQVSETLRRIGPRAGMRIPPT